MSLPSGVTAATLTAKVTKTSPSSPITISASIAPSVDLTHEESGVKLSAMIETLVSGPNPSEFLVPHSSQAGFVNDAGTPVPSWYYVATITSLNFGGYYAYAPQTRFFQLPADITAAELETLTVNRTSLPDAPATPAVEVEAPGAMVFRGTWKDTGVYRQPVGWFEDGNVPTTGWEFSGTPTIEDDTDAGFGLGSTKALQLPATADSQTSYAEFTFDVPDDASIYVRYHLESETTYDLLRLYLDGGTDAVYTDSGFYEEFQDAHLPVAAGEHTLKIEFSRDSEGTSGGLDNVRIGSIGYWATDTPTGVEPYALGSVVRYGEWAPFWVAVVDNAPGRPEAGAYWGALAAGPAA